MKYVRLFVIAGCLNLAMSATHASTLVEHFASDPLQNGWQIFGDTNLFQWDSTNQVLDVTWDSTQPNSYFYHPLDKTLTTNDGFCVQFDLQLTNSATAGYGMEIAIGLLRWTYATNDSFSRPNSPSPNLFEFDYYPAYSSGGYSQPDTVSASIVDAAANYRWNADYQTFSPGQIFHVTLLHRAGTTGICGTISTNGQVMSTFPLAKNYYPEDDSGAFFLDTLAVMNYADDGYGDSVYAQGTVANFAFASPLPVDSIQTPAAGQVQFNSDTNWLYTLEETTDFQAWSPAAPASMGNGTNLVLQTTNPPADASFYRVRAELP